MPTFQAVHKTHATVAESGSQTFSYTGSQQTFTVPSGVSSLTVDMKGASGGENARNSVVSYGNHIPGLGGRIQTTLTVTSGSTIYMYVGGRGSDASSSAAGPGGWNGGGNGGARGNTYKGGGGSWGGGGGGSSYADGSYTSSTTHTQGNNDGNGEIIITW